MHAPRGSCPSKWMTLAISIGIAPIPCLSISKQRCRCIPIWWFTRGPGWENLIFRVGPDWLAPAVGAAMVSPMSTHSIHIRSESPDLLVQFDLPPGTHARIGASPQAEVTLPLGGIPPFSCILGRFHDGRLYLAGMDGAISRRVDLPDVLPIPPYYFRLFKPADTVETAPPAPEAEVPSLTSTLSQKLKNVLALFTSGGSPPAPGGPS